jgi:hypothetical protein
LEKTLLETENFSLIYNYTRYAIIDLKRDKILLITTDKKVAIQGFKRLVAEEISKNTA